MLVQLSYDTAEFKAEIKTAKAEYVAAVIRAFNRMGLFVEAKAVVYARVNTGRMRQSIHSERAEYDHATDHITVVVAADTAYSFFVEMGFQGHFVPFQIAPDLYYQALRQWGWRIPSLSDIPTGAHNVGRRWLIPRGRSRPVWGVNVSGKARPFMRPALDDLFKTGINYQILREEFAKVIGVGP